MPPRSKRQRKQKDLLSLRSKHSSQSHNDQLHTHPLYYSDDALNDTNAFILPSSDKQQQHTTNDDDNAAPPQQVLSKSQQRKLKKIQEEKERRDKRAQVFASLAEHQLDTQALAVLRPASSRGQKDSKKESLRRMLQLERMGVKDEEGSSILLQERKRKPSLQHDGSDSDDGSSDDDEEGVCVYNNDNTKKKINTTTMNRDDSSSDDDDEDSQLHNRQSKMPRLHNTLQDNHQNQQRPSATTTTTLRDAVDQARAEIILDTTIPHTNNTSDDDDNNMNRQPTRIPSTTTNTNTTTTNNNNNKQHRVVLVDRTEDIQAVRLHLPIIGMEQEIMEAISDNDVVLLCGETGCGKTTQVPQFLYEAGYGCQLFAERKGMIGVTQPRRVAAVSTATRVAEELSSDLGDIVGYQVRYDRQVGSNTAMKFMTDGILLREVQEDFLLRKYSALIIDEAHERSLNTDILLGMLSRIVTLRRKMSSSSNNNNNRDDDTTMMDQDDNNTTTTTTTITPLKLIIMSATLRIEDFVNNKKLFPSPPPVVSVPARQYPVTVHFSKKTELHDYVNAAFKKVCQIHRKLPPGGILVFLTGQREVEYLCRKLRKTFMVSSSNNNTSGGSSSKKSKKSGSGNNTIQDNDSDDNDDDVMVGADAAEATDTMIDNDRYINDDDNDNDLDKILSSSRNNKGYHDDYDDYDDGEDEDEVVVLGGDGFTPEQIAEAEKNFENNLLFATTTTTQNNNNTNNTNTNTTSDEDNSTTTSPVLVLPLYAMLAPKEQSKCFQPPPLNHRLIIIATNVAETSLTIPGIRYVVDAGRSKQRLLESHHAGLARYDVRWISKASAEQRAGRAGRTGPGHCYRLFSSALYNDTFPLHTAPEIVNTALEGVALNLKALGVDKIENFPFPTSPEMDALKAAERCLVALNALESGNGRLTEMGRAMAKYPISPRHARMLIEVLQQQIDNNNSNGSGLGGDSSSSGKKKKRKKGERDDTDGSMMMYTVLGYAVALAAVSSVDSPFVAIESIHNTKEEERQGDDDDNGDKKNKNDTKNDTTAKKKKDKEEKERRRKELQAARAAQSTLKIADSDVLSALCALVAFEQAGEDDSFCRQHYLHYKNLKEAAALRKQLARIVISQLPQQQQQMNNDNNNTSPTPLQNNAATQKIASPPVYPPHPTILLHLKKALAAGWADHVARRVRSLDHIHAQSAKDASSLHKKSRAIRYRTCGGTDDDVFLHPNSMLYGNAPEYVVYSELIQTVKRPYMASITTIDARWLPAVAAPLCQFSEPLTDPPPYYDRSQDRIMAWVDVTFGRHDWTLPRYAILHPDAKERYAVFAAALLDGIVLLRMKELKSAFAVPPSMAARPDMRMHERVYSVIDALERRRVDSRAQLARVWSEDGSFLSRELMKWMKKGNEGVLKSVWSALVNDCLNDG